MIPRRVVTGIKDGKSVFLSDGASPGTHLYQGWPGFMTALIWATEPVPTLPPGPLAEPACAGVRITPPPGETRFMIVRLPPDTVFADPRFDPEQAAQEQQYHLPGLFECFEAEDPGMHRTNSVDYDIVLDGEIWLELDDGQEVHLKQGDVAIQQGTRHAWRNRSQNVTTMAFVLIGAE